MSETTKITKEDVRKLASLARISIEPEQEEKLASDMENILGYVNSIQAVSGDVSMQGKEKNINALREDTEAHESGNFTESIVREMPAKQGNYLKVKKILG